MDNENSVIYGLEFQVNYKDLNYVYLTFIDFVGSSLSTTISRN